MAEVAGDFTIVIATRVGPTKRRTYATEAQLNDLPLFTYWHRVHRRPSRHDTTVKREDLTPEKKALVDYVLRLAARGYPAFVKFLRYLAQ